MARDNAEIVRGGFEAWDAGDDDALPTYFSPDVEIDASDRVLNPAVYRGLEGARRFRSEISETWGGFSVEIEELLVFGDGWSRSCESAGRAAPAERPSTPAQPGSRA
jgi:ketosteroid isomerase-like protein